MLSLALLLLAGGVILGLGLAIGVRLAGAFVLLGVFKVRGVTDRETLAVALLLAFAAFAGWMARREHAR